MLNGFVRQWVRAVVGIEITYHCYGHCLPHAVALNGHQRSGIGEHIFGFCRHDFRYVEIVKKAKRATKATRTKVKATRPKVKPKKRTRKVDDGELSPAADKWLGDATAEFNRKQKVLNEEWGFNAFERWEYHPPTKTFSLTFSDGTRFEADGLVLGTYSPSDGSWEWAWNNPNVEPEIAVPADKLKDIGKRLKISYMSIGMVPAPTRDFASYLCAIGMKVTDAIGVYLGGGDPTEVAIVLFNPRKQAKAA